jgi:sulfate permease, SulP family
MKDLSARTTEPPSTGVKPGSSMMPGLATAGRDLTAGVIVSLASVSFYVSAASLLFQGALAPHLPVAIGAALLGAAVLAVFGAARGSLPLASVGPVPTTVPVQAAITAAVVAQTAAPAALPTVVASMAITGLAIGASWWVMGRYRAGDLIRYIPYPVVGGFLGSIGWLMLTGGMGVAIGRNFSLREAWGWISGQADARLACGIALGVLIWWFTQRIKHVLTLPGVIVLAGLAIHAGLWQAGMDLASARAQGWLLAPFSQTLPVWPWSPDLLGAVHWGVVAQQSGLILSAMMAATISLLLSDTSLEVAWEERADINRDLRALGQGNLLAAFAGGLAGGVSISQSVLNRDAGAASRGSGLAKAGICLLAMAWGGPVIALVPRPLLGGLLIYLGLGMLKGWIIDSHRRLPKSDYLTVLAIVGTTIVVGLLPAVFVGVLVCCLEFAVSSARQTPLRRLLTRSAWPGKVERSAAHADFLQIAGKRLCIVELQGVLFFGSVTLLTRDVEALLEDPAPPERLLFDFQRVYWVDSSAGQALARFFKMALRHGVRIDISQPSELVRRALEAAGCLGAGGPTVHADIDAAVSDWDEAVLAGASVTDRTFEAGLTESLPSGTTVEQVMSYFESVVLAPGSVLFTQGDASDALYLVRSGRLSAYVQVGGRELAMRAILAGGAIGEMGLFRSMPRSATIRADQPSVVLRLHRTKLEAMESRHPELAAALYRLFLRQLAGRIDQLTAQANALSH